MASQMNTNYIPSKTNIFQIVPEIIRIKKLFPNIVLFLFFLILFFLFRLQLLYS